MCGIAGYVSDTMLAPEVLAAMTRSLAHRGPDADGFYTSGRAHLGHRRLSVIDIVGSPQPMTSPDGLIAVVYNGEIYNFRELREELARGGWTFRSAGDTETLVAGWSCVGEDLVTHLRGMFAFALWDARTQTLFAARDHLGVKPFHYAWDGATLRVRLGVEGGARASFGRGHDRPRGAAALPRVPVHSRAALGVRRVRKLPPGHSLKLEGTALDIRSYWRPDVSRQVRPVRSRRSGRARRELRASVEGMLVADVPLGAFVSGGVDSGLIAAGDDRPHGAADRHVQHRVRRRSRGQRASRSRASRAAHRQPPSRADALARPRARRVRPLDRRVRRAVRRPGGAADHGCCRGSRAAP
jgi:asparagine synthase (glutamine-hydrolysing)